MEQGISFTLSNHALIWIDMVGDLSQKLRELCVIPKLFAPHVLLLIVELDVEKLGEEHTHSSFWRPGSSVDENGDDGLVQQIGQVHLVVAEKNEENILAASN